MNKYCVVCNKGKVPARLPRIIPVIEEQLLVHNNHLNLNNNHHHQHHHQENAMNETKERQETSNKFSCFRKKLLQIAGTALRK